MAEEGLFILAPLSGEVAERIREVNRRYDPRLGQSRPPHVTITGSSGAGPIPHTVTVQQLTAALEPIARTTPVLQLKVGAPERFLGTDVITLPLDPHGPIRTLHDRIATSGLPFGRARFTFTPHVTLSLYPTNLNPEKLRELLSIRIDDPIIIDTIDVYHTRDPQPAKKLLEFKLMGHGH